ncbi:MAG TPA: hypothetical protein VLE95_02030, partial [Chlamydiales bacterium]|nr:hypothetical protein [Chlamydiales bacterium]
MKNFFLKLLILFTYGYAGQTSIGIFTFGASNGSKSWDSTAIQSGITGSEEAIIYLSKELAELGYRVTVFGNPPTGSADSLETSNPRYVDASGDNGQFFDIAIAWRAPVSYPLQKRGRKVYLWPHDVYFSILPSEQADGFEEVLWLSEWQRMQWISANPKYQKYTCIFGNGIFPEQFPPVRPRDNPYSCIYASNYGRGLEILLEIWPRVKVRFPQATLDIYYGWQHWGTLTSEKEAKMRARLNEIAHLDVHDHGLVGHQELMEAFGKASFWTYPCIAAEVFCITALRAQLAGAIPVIIEHSALQETVRSGYRCASPNEYFSTLIKALRQAEQVTLEQRLETGRFVLDQFTWKNIAKQW